MKIDVESTTSGFFVVVNKDLTEGRGPLIPLSICHCESTAFRKAQKADVQGTTGKVYPVDLFRIGGWWYGPVYVEDPSKADTKMEEQLAQEKQALAKKKEVIAKAAKLGLSEHDLAILQG